MVLLDKILEVSDNHIVVEVIVREDTLFSSADRTVPAWVGIEYMAQTIAAYSGYHRKLGGQAIGLGFLLGTRLYQCSVESFPCGIQLRVRAEKVMDGANDMSVFDCSIKGDNIVANSRINVLLPQDSEKFLTDKGLRA